MNRNKSMKGMKTPANYFKEEALNLKAIARPNPFKVWMPRVAVVLLLLGVGTFGYTKLNAPTETITYANYLVDEQNWDLYENDLIEEVYVDLLVKEERKNEIEDYIVDSYELDDLMDY